MSNRRTATEAVLHIVRDDIRALKQYHVQPATGMLKLDAMESPYELPEHLRHSLAERLAHVALNRYPVPTPPELKVAIKKAWHLDDSLDVVFGNGSDELLALITTILAKPGATIVAPEPSFVMYKMYALFDQLNYVGVPLTADFALDEAAMITAIRTHRAALTWLAYPNNPTGNLFDHDAIVRIIEVAAEHHGLVVIDEAYFAYASGVSMLPLLKTHANVLVVRTLSKLGLAGTRFGVAIGQAAWINEIDKVRPPYNVNVLTQTAVAFALDHYNILIAQADCIVAERVTLQAALRAMGVEQYDSAANFVLIRLKNAEQIHGALKSRGILVRIFHGSHPLLAQTLRVNVSSPEENQQFLSALQQLLS